MRTRQTEEDKAIEELVNEDFLYFLLEKWLISSGESAGEPYSFRDRPFLLDIVKDTFPYKVEMKSAQSGLSEINSAEAIWRAKTRKGNILYTFPAGEQLQQFVDSRPRNAIAINPYLQKFVTGSLNLKKFSICNNQIFFRGVQKRRQIISIDVNSIFVDEIDAYDEPETIIDTLTKRLGASASPTKRYFSTASFHGTGIALFYYGSDSHREKGSDQRVYSYRCTHCGQWNEDLLFPENLIDLNEKDVKFSHYQPNVIIVCRFCHKALDRLNALKQWVPKLTSNSNYCHGYHISKLLILNSNLNDMWLDSQNPLKEQEFWNSDMGLPYEPKGSRITDSVLDNCRGTHTILRKIERKTCVGVDIGNKIHVVAGYYDENNIPKLMDAQELDDWDELDRYYDQVNCGCMVIDMNPDKDEAIAFQTRHSNVWLAFYGQYLEKTSDLFAKNLDDNILSIHRTLMMMTVSDIVHNKQVAFPMDIRSVKGFYEHLKAPIKAQKQDVHGDWVTWYPKTKNADHYYHTLIYWFSALQLKPKPAIFSLKKMFV